MSVTTTRTRTGFPSVNLLPPETRDRQKTRRRMGVVAVVGVAALVVVGLVYYLQSNHEADLKDKVAAQSATNAALQQQVTTLQPFEQLKETLTARQALATTALAGDISWSNLLHELAVSVPSKAWLVSFTGSASATSAEAGLLTPTAAPTGIVGNISFGGSTLAARTLS